MPCGTILQCTFRGIDTPRLSRIFRALSKAGLVSRAADYVARGSCVAGRSHDVQGPRLRGFRRLSVSCEPVHIDLNGGIVWGVLHSA